MSSSAPQQLLQKNVFTAYLQPLLSKHERQKIITYEDLTASWQAAMAALSQGKQQHKEHVPAVQKEITALHQNQVRAYREAAKTALQAWADHVSLPPPNNDTTMDLAAYQQKCRAAAESSRPAWNVTKPFLQTAYQRIEERAAEQFQQQQQQQTSTLTGSSSSKGTPAAAAEPDAAVNNDDGDNKDEEEEEGELSEEEEEGGGEGDDVDGDEEEGEVMDEAEDGEENEEEEVGDADGGGSDEDGEVTEEPVAKQQPKQPTTTTKPKQQPKNKKGGILAKKKQGLNKGKTAPAAQKRKGPATKAGAPSNRGRRVRGRGGGGRGGSNTTAK